MTLPLRAENLYRFFHAGDSEALALRGVSLTTEAGEMVTVSGPSGSGKSTLMACLAGLDEPDGGTVWIGGEVMSRRSEPAKAAIRSRGIGVLLQSSNLVEHLTVRDNILVAQRLAGRVDRQRSETLCELTGITKRAHALPSQLSRGEAARAGLAVALANDPILVLADEPTGELDGESERQIITLLRSVAERRAAVVVVTHNPEVSSAADRCLKLADGRWAR